MSMENQMDAKTKASFTPISSGLLQRKCDKCRRNQILQRSALQNGLSRVPPIVHDVLRSPGQPLDQNTRAFMEPRFGKDFSQVRVHTDAKANESARAVNARAYTVRENIAFGKGRYAPSAEHGRKLLAHELAHVVQQSRGDIGSDPELSADIASKKIVSGGYVIPEMIGGAIPGLYAQGNEERKEPNTPSTRPAFSLSWDALAQPGMFQLRPPSLGVPALTPPSMISHLPSSQLTLTSPLDPSSKSPTLLPSGTSKQKEEPAPQMPSRLPFVSSGSFSLGLRLGFPSSEAKDIPGMAGSALAESMRRAEIMNQTLTGKIPSSWEALDKAKLAGALWGIFSTKIAPDLASNITSRLSTSTGKPGASYELDLVLLTDFSGGGLSFGIRY